MLWLMTTVMAIVVSAGILVLSLTTVNVDPAQSRAVGREASDAMGLMIERINHYTEVNGTRPVSLASMDGDGMNVLSAGVGGSVPLPHLKGVAWATHSPSSADPSPQPIDAVCIVADNEGLAPGAFQRAASALSDSGAISSGSCGDRTSITDKIVLSVPVSG